MARKCPKCGSPNSLDYDPNYKVWRCVWVDCNYIEEKKMPEILVKSHEIINVTMPRKVFKELFEDNMNYIERIKYIKNIYGEELAAVIE